MLQNVINASLPDKIFSIISQKKHTPEDFPRNFNFSRSAGQNEITALSLDTSQIDANTYYFLSDQEFFTQNIEGLKAIVYFRHLYGDEVTKILRLQTGNTVKEITLALQGGDGLDSYRQSGEFVNDSIFIETSVVRETIRDDQNHVAYKTDSVISVYQYNQMLDLSLVNRDTLRFTEDYIYDSNYALQQASRSQKSTLFRVNNVPYFWNFATTFHHEPGERITSKPRFAEFAMQLTRASDGEVVLSDGDFKATDQIDVTDLRADGFVDLNFDGYKDFYNYSNQNSGSGGAFFNAYIFNPGTGKFDYSEEFSGGELTV
ncbi:MAG: hypothetical protein EOO07_33645, partial [Chitinophagaceae bacterium]